MWILKSDYQTLHLSPKLRFLLAAKVDETKIGIASYRERFRYERHVSFDRMNRNKSFKKIRKMRKMRIRN